MTIAVTGGGSGGHITPLLAVADELKRLQPDVQVVYIGQKGDKLADIPAKDPAIDSVYGVQAGKFRRYHGEGLRQLLDLKTLLLNARDGVRALIGCAQAYRLLKRLKPDAIFIKGGFVGVPVGLSAAWLHIPYVTHDSDAIPGLANRIVARWARYHAVAMPKELYSYPTHKTFVVGVPTHGHYSFVNNEAQKLFKTGLGLPADGSVLLVTGGGLGADRINGAVIGIAADLLAQQPKLTIFHQVGRANLAAVTAQYQEKLSVAEQGRVRVLGYTSDLYRYSGAADVILSRAGATAIAEFAVQGKACVLVANPYLTAGHQLKNAQVLAETGAVSLINESSLKDDLPLVITTLSALLGDTKIRAELAERLHHLAHPDAASELAELILKASHKPPKQTRG